MSCPMLMDLHVVSDLRRPNIITDILFMSYLTSTGTITDTTDCQSYHIYATPMPPYAVITQRTHSATFQESFYSHLQALIWNMKRYWEKTTPNTMRLIQSSISHKQDRKLHILWIFQSVSAHTWVIETGYKW